MTHPRPNPLVLHFKGKVACCTCELMVIPFLSPTQFLLPQLWPPWQALSLARLSVASRTVVTVALLHRELQGIVAYELRLLDLEILDDRSGLNMMNSAVCAFCVEGKSSCSSHVRQIVLLTVHRLMSGTTTTVHP